MERHLFRACEVKRPRQSEKDNGHDIVESLEIVQRAAFPEQRHEEVMQVILKCIPSGRSAGF